MTAKQPPGVATWLLKHFGSGPHIETLLGDLAEQYQQHHSATRYWRQATKAIPVSFFRDIRRHKWSAAKALLTGWMLWILAGSLIFPVVFYNPNAGPSDPRLGIAFVPSDPLGSLMTLMTVPAFGFASFHPKGPWFSPMAFLFAITLPLIVGIVSGWLSARWQVCAQTEPPSLRIARVDRDQQTSVVLLFTGSVFLMNLLPFVLWVGPQVESLAGLLAVNTAASVLGILLGGGIFRDRSMAETN